MRLRCTFRLRKSPKSIITLLLRVDRELQIDATTLLCSIVVLKWHILIVFSGLALLSLVCSIHIDYTLQNVTIYNHLLVYPFRIERLVKVKQKKVDFIQNPMETESGYVPKNILITGGAGFM